MSKPNKRVNKDDVAFFQRMDALVIGCISGTSAQERAKSFLALANMLWESERAYLSMVQIMAGIEYLKIEGKAESIDKMLSIVRKELKKGNILGKVVITDPLDAEVIDE